MLIATTNLMLIKYMRKHGMIEHDTGIMGHPLPIDVAGMDVVGELPLRLAAMANSVTVPVIEGPICLGCEELTACELEKYLKGWKTYVVHETMGIYGTL